MGELNRHAGEGPGIPPRLRGLVQGQFSPGKEGARVLWGGQGVRGRELLTQATALEPEHRRVPGGRRWQRPGHLVPE